VARFDRWAAVAVFGCLVWLLVYSFARKPIQGPPANVQILRETVHYYDTVYRTDTIRLRVAVARWDTVLTRDTITRNDTVFVPRDEAVAVLSACQQALMTCERRVIARDSLHRAELDAVRAQIPPRWKAWAERGAWAVLVYAALTVR
jgi:hypothetical protein